MLLAPQEDPATRSPLSQRMSEGLGRVLERRRPGRRGFLRRSALVATALAVNPMDFLLRPQSAYASVCGPANECSQGWTAFCCTVNGGANTCPDGSYAAGWWKVSSSAFCRGGDRYVVDCNRLPEARCSCECADGPCDRRRVCCNNFRYGQCNQQVAGTTEVVCRVVICTPPWEWDPSCTTTVRTDERTRDHSASCLNGPDPSLIAMAYQDAGLVGSALGAPTGEELALPGGGSWRPYEHGVITSSEAFGLVLAAGPAAEAYRDLHGPEGILGILRAEPVEVAGGTVLPAAEGAVYATPDARTFALHGPIDEAYTARGGPEGWLGFPVTGVVDAPGGRERTFFESGWSLVLTSSTADGEGEVRLLPSDVELPADAGEWPATAPVVRWAGPDRVATAVTVSRETHPGGADAVVLASAGGFADALAGGVLAAVLGGPVLLTATSTLSEATAEELARLEPTRVVVVGGPRAVGEEVLAAIAEVLPAASVRRVAGADRFATAAAIAGEVAEAVADTTDGAPEEEAHEEAQEERRGRVLLANGREFPDALAATPTAAREGSPLLLTEAEALPSATAEALQRLAPEMVVVVGGEAVVGAAVVDAVERTGATVQRVAGAGRYETAVALLDASGPTPAEALLVASGERFADALPAGAGAVAAGAALLLSRETSLPAATRHAITAVQPGIIVVVGGTAALSATVAEQLAATPVEPVPRREDPAAVG